MGPDWDKVTGDLSASFAESRPAAVQEARLAEVTGNAFAAADLPMIVGDALTMRGPATAEPATLLASSDGGPVEGQTPYGAAPADGSEFMLGDVWVTVVLMESNGGIDPQTETWSASRIATVKSEILEGLDWWEATLATQFPGSPHTLDFHVDFTYADSPVPTGYEPITRPQSQEGLWIDSFLNHVSHNSVAGYGQDVADWNNERRLANDSDWAFTVFVVDSLADTDGKFSDGYFAYAYIGGPFLVMTYDNNGWGISRMGQVLGHETGHIFYALDEYPGASSYTAHSGYYSTQNLNAYNGHPNPASRVPSLMAEATLQNLAYPQNTSSPSSLAMVGWQDSDGDGVFDVLDVPLTLAGSGTYDAAEQRYEFVGTSSVGLLTNLNPYGLSHDITINTVDRIQYRLDGGAWIDGNAYGSHVANVTQDVPVVVNGVHTIEFRTIVEQTGVTSPVWSDTFQFPLSSEPPVLVSPMADVSVSEDAAGTVIDLAEVFDDPDLATGDTLTYTATVSATVSDVLARISQASYTHTHQDLLYTHTGDDRGFGAEHDLARDNVADYLTSLGLATSLHPFTYSSQTYYNVVATKPGTTRPNDVYVVGAHYDSVNNPGADDNASGTAAVMEIARALAPYSFDATLTFVLFDREEQGLIGSQAYAAAAQARGDQILGMVNLDMIAYNPGGANQVKIYDGDGLDVDVKQDLLDAFNVFHYGGALTAADGGWTDRSDHRSFDVRGYDAAMIIEAAWTGNPHYHRTTDAVETANYIDYAFATGVTTAAAGYLASAAGVRQPVSLVAASVQGSQLVLDWAEDGHGTALVTVRATDSSGAWVEDSFAVAVSSVADAPVVTEPLDDLAVMLNAAPASVALSGVFADADAPFSGDWLTFSVAGNTNPALVGAAVTASDLALNFLPNQSGTAQITIRATDSSGAFAEDTLLVTVSAPPASAQIIDNGEAGFSTAAGSFLYYTSAGAQSTYGYFRDDTHYRAAGTGTNRVQWSFSGLLPGTYQVAATWGPSSNRATNAPYGIQGNGSGDAAIAASVNQRLAPGSYAGAFTDQGVAWAILRSEYVLGAGGNTITVTLSDAANGYVMADALRILPLTQSPAAEIDVQLDGVSLSDGTAVVDFGQTDVGEPVSKTFAIRNLGTVNLSVGAVLSLPAGFQLAGASPATLFGGSSSTMIAAGGQAAFTVQFDAASAGVFGGMLSFVNGDADENPFNFTLQADAIAVAAPEIEVQLDSVSLSDGSAVVDFGQTGVGTPISRTFAIRNTGNGDLSVGAVLSLPAGFQLAGAAPAALFGGSSSTTIAAGGQATFTVRFDAAAAGVFGGTLSFVNGDADENPFDFALQAEATAASVPTIIDNGEAGFSVVAGSFLYYTSAGAQTTYGYFRDDTHYRAAGTGKNRAQWTFSGLLPGTYQVAATWGPHTNRASNAPYLVLGNGSGDQSASASINQRLAPGTYSGSFSDQGVSWALLSNNYVLGAGGNTISVTLSDAANGYVMADAVRIVRLAGSASGAPESDEWSNEAGFKTGSDIVSVGRIETGAASSRTIGIHRISDAGLTVGAELSSPGQVSAENRTPWGVLFANAGDRKHQEMLPAPTTENQEQFAPEVGVRQDQASRYAGHVDRLLEASGDWLGPLSLLDQT